MGINKTLLALLNGIDQYKMDDDYGLKINEVHEFMYLKTNKTDFPRKQEKAVGIIKEIMIAHKKDQLYPYLKELADFEYNARGIAPYLRDHVVHALLSFILGICIKEKFIKYFKQKDEVSELQWKIAGLFHDIGYPLEVASNIMGSFTKKINCLKNKIDINASDVNIEITPVRLGKLTNDCSLCLIQDYLDNDKGFSINVKEECIKMIGSGRISHGMISSLTVLYIVDLLYQKNNSDQSNNQNDGWNRKYFYNDIVPACSAIFIHDLPKECFSKKNQINPSKAPLAFLLRLSDCLQDWDRPSKNNRTGFSDDQYDIDISNNRLTFTVEDKDQRAKIYKEISETLDINSRIDEQCSEIILAFQNP